MNQTILIVEDETSIADNIRYALETEHLTPVWCETADEARKKLSDDKIDLVILDIGLPDENGLEFCKEIRKQSEVPIIFLTARTTEIDRILGLEIGGDDYVTKPFSPRELTARVKAILRRTHQLDNKQQLTGTDDFTVDEESCQITFRGETLKLSKYEYLLLSRMLKHPKRVYSRRQLMDLIWEDPHVSMERTVDTHIKTLRSKLKVACPEREIIKTHRGFGYSLY